MWCCLTLVVAVCRGLAVAQGDVVPSNQDILDAIWSMETLFTNRLNRLDDTMSNVRSDIALIKGSMDSLEGEVTASQHTRDIVNDMQHNVTQELQALKAKAGALDQKFSEILNETLALVNTVQKDTSLYNINASASMNKIQQSIDSAKQPLNLLTSKVSSIDVNIQNTSDLLKTVKETVNSVKANVFSVKESVINSVNDNVNSVKVVVNSVKEIVYSVKDNITSAKDPLSFIITKVTAIQDDIDDLQNTVEEKTLLTMNPMEITVYVSQEARLDCGIIGVYRSCYWNHNGLIYQHADVSNGSYSVMKTASDSLNNQCGISIPSVRADHEGVWTCNVLSFGRTLTASKTLTIGECDPACNNGGTCTGPTNCTCTESWTGPTCEIPVCDPACNNGGKCTAPKSCTCAEYWTGPACEIPVCEPPCNNGGTCLSSNTCSCLVNYRGPTCEIPPMQLCPEGFYLSRVSGQCFKLFNDKKRTWFDAKSKCEQDGLHLAEPSDVVAVTLRKYLLDTYGDINNVWLGARGDGSKMMWQRSGTVLRSDNTLWYPGGHSAITSRCLGVWVYWAAWGRHPERPYYFDSCSSTRNTLCEMA